MLRLRASAIPLLAWVTFGIILAYLLAWYHVPLFYDEVAFRIYRGRAFVDGFSLGSLLPQCSATGPTAWPLLPAQLVYSWIDGWPAWLGVRTMPLLALGALLAVTSRTLQKQPWAVMLLCGAFVGISGLGMVLSRPEHVLLLHAACIVVTWQLSRKPPLPAWQILLVVVAHLFIISLSLLAHLQGVLLMPLSFITCMQVLRRRTLAAVLVAVLMVIATSSAALNGSAVHCPNDPQLEKAVKATQGSGIAAQEKGSWAQKMVTRFERYERQFFFRAQPEAFSLPLPPIPQRMVHALNVPVAVVVTINLFILLAAMAATVPVLWRRYRQGKWRARVNALFADGHFLWFLATFILIAYCVYEVSGTFYRAYVRNLLTVILIAIAAAHIVGPRSKKLLKAYSIFVGVTCLASAAVAWVLIAPPLKQGYEGIGVSLQRDWPVFNASVADLAQRCGITTDTSRLIVDDTTYAALRHYHAPIGYNYLWVDEILIKGAIQQKTPGQRLARIRQLGGAGYVVRCDALERFKLPVDHRAGDVCCHLIRD